MLKMDKSITDEQKMERVEEIMNLVSIFQYSFLFKSLW